MATTKKALYSACLIFLGVGAASADSHAPKNLHMRKLRVAQTPPPDTGGAPPPDTGSASEPAPPPPPPAPPPTPPAPPATPEAPPPAAAPSDEELARMAAEEAEKTQGEEV